MFATNSIPHAKGTVFFGPWKAIAFARKHGFPLVVKPNVGGFSRGSYFPIVSFKELLKAVFMVKIWWPTSVIEQYLEGKNYRVVVVAGEIMAVIRRYPPFVDGDGSSSIGELIDRENEIRENMDLYPVIHPIPKDGKIKGYLRKNGQDLDTIAPSGERVRLYNRISLAPGGVVETLEKESMAPENKDMFLEILSHFGANILGIDAIFEKGIETSYREQRCILLEVNSRPYLKMHDVPRYGKKEDLTEFYQRLNSLVIEKPDIY